MRKQLFRNGVIGTAEASEAPVASARALAAPLLVFAIVGLLIASAGAAVYRWKAADIREHAAAELRAAARLVGTQYGTWYDDRVRGMRHIGSGPFTMRSVAEWRLNRSTEIEELLRDRLAAIQSNHQFSGVAALTPEGSTLLAVGEPIAADADLDRVIRAAIESDDVEVRFLATTRGQAEQRPSVEFVVVLRDHHAAAGPHPPVAVVVARAPVPKLSQDVVAVLGRPVPQAVLVRPDGDGIGVIEWGDGDGEGRYLIAPGGGDVFAISQDPGGSGEVRAARDHHGREVLASGTRVGGTPWIAVAAVEQSLVDGHIRDVALLIVGASVLGFVGASMLLLPWWRSLKIREVARVQAAESRAEEMATRLGWVTRHANDAILLLGDRGEILDANDRAVQSYGYALDELLSLTVFQLRSADAAQQAAAQAQFGEVLRRESLVFEAVHSRKDGSTFPVEVSSRQVEFRGRRYVQSIVRDISKRRHAESRLRDSEAQYRLLFSTNPQPMWVYDLQTLRFLAVNDAAVGHYGYTEDEFLAMTIADIRPEEDRARLVANVRAHADDTLQRAGSWRHSRKDGSVIEVEITSHRIDFDGRPARLVLASDITDRVRAERALRASEERYRGLFANASDGILLIDRDRRILAANPEFQSMLGYTQQELLGTELAAFLDPEERPRLEQMHAGLRAGRRPSPGNWIHLRKGGSRLTAEVRFRPLPDGDVLATVRDLTELLSARRRIERQRDLYALLSQCNEASVRTADRSELLQSVARLAVERGRFLFAWIGEIDEAGCVVPVASYGDDGGYLAGLDLSVNADSPSSVGPTAQALRSGQPVVVNRFLADARTALWHEPGRSIGIRASAAFPIRCAGQVTMALMLYAPEEDFFEADIVATLEEMAADVSHALDALRTRKELDEQRLLLQSIIDATDALVYATDLAGRIILTNTACARAVGIDRDRQLGRERAEFLPAETARAHAENDRRVIESGRPLTVEERNIEAGVERVYLSTKYPLKDANGRLYAVGGISTDITERLRMQEALAESNRSLERKVAERTREAREARERAEAADRAKGVFLSSMSHEFRSPLNSIIGFTSVLLDGLDGPLSDVQQEHLKIVKDASQHLLSIINDVLDMSKIEAGVIALELRDLPISRPLQRVLQRFSLQARSKGLELRLQGPDPDLWIRSDELRIEQVVSNLVANAIKYTDSGSVVVRCGQEDAWLKVDVIDTGPGIPEVEHSRVFARFAQLPAASGTLQEGTGLGLAIAAGLATALGGHIVLESRPGAGSTFSLRLPLGSGSVAT